MNDLIYFLIVLPLIGFIISLIPSNNNEKTISRIVNLILITHLGLSIYSIFHWIAHEFPYVDLNVLTVSKTESFLFDIELYFDKISACFLIVGSFLTFMVSVFCRYYLHKESGYKRFFNIILLFFFAYNLVIMAGNFETLFIGWEVLGLTSFLLIGFYRERYLPVTNSFKVFSYYRIGDLGFLLAMWGSHHIFGENIHFIQLNDYNFVENATNEHYYLGVLISLGFLLCAVVKSAQFPFSTWLPRAMEGPTPSSAIFYGSLSVHLGAFLMMRTYNFWTHHLTYKLIVGILGVITVVVSTIIARSQTNIKSQIAYSSIAQIGIMFVEIAAGFINLALVHFVGNAFLRAYQLLISPSAVSYLIREQLYNFIPKNQIKELTLLQKIKNNIYVLSLKEFELDAFIGFVFWEPLKRAGKVFKFLNLKNSFFIFSTIFIIGIILETKSNLIPEVLNNIFPTIFSFLGLILVLRSYSERENPYLAWILVVMNHFWIVLSIYSQENFDVYEIILYLSGVSASGIVGFLSLYYISNKVKNFSLNSYYGYVSEYPIASFIFLLAALGNTGFPITSTFLGEDMVFDHINENSFLLAIFTALSYVFVGISSIRIYARLFLGINKNTQEDIPFQNS